MSKQTEALKLALEALSPWAGKDANHTEQYAAYHAIHEALAEQPAQQEPVAKVCHDLDGHIGWNPNLKQLPDEGAALYTSPPASKQWADECRIELVNAIHFLASDFENALGAFRGDTEARRKAEGDIAHARSIASRWNWNGTTEPASKPWVGLTEEEIEGLLPPADGSAEENKVRVEVQPGIWGVEYDEVDAWSLPLVRQAIRAIEAKLREKNA